MRRLTLAALLGLTFLLDTGAARAEHPFGLGIMLGSPTGLTGKLYLGGKPFALDMGIGVVHSFQENFEGLHLFVDVVWHPVMLTRQPSFNMPLYLGVGGRLLRHDFGTYVVNGVPYNDSDTHLGVRAPLGILMDFKNVQVDVFLELALVVDLIYLESYGPYRHYHDAVDLNAAIGVRYYF